MPRECFAYRRAGFLLTTVLLMLITAFIVALFFMIGSDVGVIVLVSVLSIGILFFYGLAPMLTRHCIDEDNLILVQGLFFRAKIPLQAIISVNNLDEGPRRTGAYLVTKKRVLYVTSRRHDLITIKLRGPQRFGMAFGRKADTVVFDCLDVPAMMTRLRSWITPANPSRWS